MSNLKQDSFWENSREISEFSYLLRCSDTMFLQRIPYIPQQPQFFHSSFQKHEKRNTKTPNNAWVLIGRIFPDFRGETSNVQHTYWKEQLQKCMQENALRDGGVNSSWTNMSNGTCFCQRQKTWQQNHWNHSKSPCFFGEACWGHVSPHTWRIIPI